MNNQHSQQSPLFLSTAIPYVNAAPHVGHALELLLGDALARHYRQRGRSVRFSGGTDDHSLKNARAAAALGQSTLALVTRNGDRFRELDAALGIQRDDFVHTSRDARHVPCVRELWRRCFEQGDLYLGHYSGKYCAGCEAFLQDAELVDAGCAVHRGPLELVSEQNWFFRLSRYREPLERALRQRSLRVQPEEREREVLSFVERGLSDFSVSRSRERARGWGIEVPGDPSQVIYVWFDALANYLSSLGFPAETPELSRFWSGGTAEREHLLGKDILRFHAVYWPAILLSAGLALPSALRVHGFVTSEGVKIGKSLDNAVDPFGLLQSYGEDALRFYFLRHLHSTKDSDFRLSRLREAHDSELAGKLGNLLQRVSSLGLRHPELALRRGRAAESDADHELWQAAERAHADVCAAFDDFALHQALAAVFELVAAANRYADAQEPWTLSRQASVGASPLARADLLAQLAHVLWRLLEVLRISAVLLAPFLPRASRSILRRIGVPEAQLASLEAARRDPASRFRLQPGPPLFPRLERAKPDSQRGSGGCA